MCTRPECVELSLCCSVKGSPVKVMAIGLHTWGHLLLESIHIPTAARAFLRDTRTHSSLAQLKGVKWRVSPTLKWRTQHSPLPSSSGLRCRGLSSLQLRERASTCARSLHIAPSLAKGMVLGAVSGFSSGFDFPIGYNA